jgi:hypothetical protein
MYPIARFGHTYGFGGIDLEPHHIKPLVELIDSITAREKLESQSTITKDNIKAYVMLAYDDIELAEKLENKFLLASTPTRK